MPQNSSPESGSGNAGPSENTNSGQPGTLGQPLSSSCSGQRHFLKCGHFQRTRDILCSNACAVAKSWTKARSPKCGECAGHASEIRVLAQIEEIDETIRRLKSMDTMWVSNTESASIETHVMVLEAQREEIGNELVPSVWRKYKENPQKYLRNLHLKHDKHDPPEDELAPSRARDWNTYQAGGRIERVESILGLLFGNGYDQSFGSNVTFADSGRPQVVADTEPMARPLEAFSSISRYDWPGVLARSFLRTKIDSECPDFRRDGGRSQCTCAAESLLRDMRSLVAFPNRSLGGSIARLLTWATFVQEDYEGIRAMVHSRHADLSQLPDADLLVLDETLGNFTSLDGQRVHAMRVTDRAWADMYAGDLARSRELHRNPEYTMSRAEMSSTLERMLDSETTSPFHVHEAWLEAQERHQGALPMFERALRSSNNAASFSDLTQECRAQLMREWHFYTNRLTLRQRRNLTMALLYFSDDFWPLWRDAFNAFDDHYLHTPPRFTEGYIEQTTDRAPATTMAQFYSSVRSRGGYIPGLPCWEDPDRPNESPDAGHTLTDEQRLRRTIILRVTFSGDDALSLSRIMRRNPDTLHRMNAAALSSVLARLEQERYFAESDWDEWFNNQHHSLGIIFGSDHGWEDEITWTSVSETPSNEGFPGLSRVSGPWQALLETFHPFDATDASSIPSSPADSLGRADVTRAEETADGDFTASLIDGAADFPIASPAGSDESISIFSIRPRQSGPADITRAEETADGDFTASLVDGAADFPIASPTGSNDESFSIFSIRPRQFDLPEDLPTLEPEPWESSDPGLDMDIDRRAPGVLETDGTEQSVGSSVDIDRQARSRSPTPPPPPPSFAFRAQTDLFFSFSYPQPSTLTHQDHQGPYYLPRRILGEFRAHTSALRRSTRVAAEEQVAADTETVIVGGVTEHQNQSGGRGRSRTRSRRGRRRRRADAILISASACRCERCLAAGLV